jgi:hypothetical protein
VQRDQNAALQAQIDTLLLERDTLKERIQQLKVTALIGHYASPVNLLHVSTIAIREDHAFRPQEPHLIDLRPQSCVQAKALAPNSASEMRMAHAVAESAQAAAAAAAAAASAASMCSIQVQRAPRLMQHRQPEGLLEASE